MRKSHLASRATREQQSFLWKQRQVLILQRSRSALLPVEECSKQEAMFCRLEDSYSRLEDSFTTIPGLLAPEPESERGALAESERERLESQVSMLQHALSKATEMLRAAFGDTHGNGRDVLDQCQRVLGNGRSRMGPARKERVN